MFNLKINTNTDRLNEVEMLGETLGAAMEKRNIKVTLEQAIEWYNSGNRILRTLALSAYTEDELKLSF